MNRALGLGRVFVFALLVTALSGHGIAQAELQAGFAEADITPRIDDPKNPVWLAGYGQGRQATSVHDPIMVRVVVLADGDDKIAIACADVVGLQYPTVQAIRAQLKDYRYVLVSSTHNHEAPDVIGIWGRTFVYRGVSDAYLKLIEDKTVAAIKEAEKSLAPVAAHYGTATDDSLLGDSRKPVVKDGVLRVLRFDRHAKPAGLLVQWNCHPEAMGSKNKALTADFVWATVAKLKKQYACPVVYVSGAVGGLMAPPDDGVNDKDGNPLREGDFEYTRVYGEMTADLAAKAIDSAAKIELTPFRVAAKSIAVEVNNAYYISARTVGVLKRPGRVWTGDAEKLGDPLADDDTKSKLAVETEVACLKLGELAIACIPGEIYPELVYGKYPAAAEAGVDFPTAPLEPSVVETLKTDKWLLVGLANDEIGYIIPKRQWDNVAPYAYGRKSGQYGEINSCGPNVAPLLMRSFQLRAAELAP